MERIEQLKTMYDYARTNGLCSNRKTFAALLNMNEGNMSSAFSGNMRYLTTNLLLRINKALGDVFSTEWLLTGTEPIYKIGDNIHHNSGNVATHGAHITNITTIPPTTPAIPTTPVATPTTPAATTPTTPAIPATDDDKDRLIAQLQARVATLQAQIDAQHEHTDLLQALQSQIATLQSQIAELKADKQNLMQLLTNLTQNK